MMRRLQDRRLVVQIQRLACRGKRSLQAWPRASAAMPPPVLGCSVGADAVCQSALERILTAITKAGATPVLVVPPTTASRNFYPSEERERELTILDFSDVRQNAKLFLPENRMDLGHVNTAGAEIFSDDLARRFVELARGPTAVH